MESKGVETMTISEALRTLLEEHDLTQKQLALDLNVAPSTLGGYVQGTSEPDVATLKRIASYFQVSMDYLLDFPKTSDAVPGENELLRIFRSLSEKERELFLEQGKLLLRFNQKEKSYSSISQSTHNVG